MFFLRIFFYCLLPVGLIRYTIWNFYTALYDKTRNCYNRRHGCISYDTCHAYPKQKGCENYVDEEYGCCPHGARAFLMIISVVLTPAVPARVASKQIYGRP